MTDDEIRELLQATQEVSAWRPFTERAWLRAYIEKQGVDMADFDAGIICIGGRIEARQPLRSLRYRGQQPVPMELHYIVPWSVFDDEPSG